MGLRELSLILLITYLGLAVAYKGLTLTLLGKRLVVRVRLDLIVDNYASSAMNPDLFLKPSSQYLKLLSCLIAPSTRFQLLYCATMIQNMSRFGCSCLAYLT